SGKNWSHGIIGIVAAKMMERYKKPTYVLEEMGEESKGSARSFGDFSVADAIADAGDVVTKGGGHKYAAGLTLPTANIAKFRKSVNHYYRTQKLFNQQNLLLPHEDVSSSLEHVSERLVQSIMTLEPFGNANPEPVLKTDNLIVLKQRKMGASSQHVKLEVQDDKGHNIQLLAFSAPANFFVEPGERIIAWYQPTINEWNGNRTIEGRLLHIEHV
ncbi:MAG: recJ, partial [Candidatus Saccharibacteria bacterium]|nr:recJ [Candidatus Saccharibacteria bacterium]